ncbi:hypothetical protein HaLaN_27570 [Haematococcus lacustris]|uniref:Uncharacterized protein n=1 Tax=Haematococcus lacustris TaxID=44745 RepID=A0A6A0A8G5_HAELA|nr:hypothetical protein HaLaN_27570 [Haematococcus lacustris]
MALVVLLPMRVTARLIDTGQVDCALWQVVRAEGERALSPPGPASGLPGPGSRSWAWVQGGGRTHDCITRTGGQVRDGGHAGWDGALCCLDCSR